MYICAQNRNKKFLLYYNRKKPLIKIVQYFRKTLSARISLWVLMSVTILFVAALVIMFRYSHHAIEQESLAKTQQMLDGKVLQIDNQLHKVEVATRNMLWNVEQHLDNPDAMVTYSVKMLESNPDITGCAIAFEPGYYKEKGESYITYTYRMEEDKDEIRVTHDPLVIEPDIFSDVPYWQVNWYNIPKQENLTCWVRPHVPNDTVNSTVVSCCMPIHDKQGSIVGVMAADISVAWLSRVVLDSKPFPHSYCTMLGVQGSYIIHPDSTKLYHSMLRDVARQEPDERVGELVESMLAGESGCRSVRLFGKDSYVLFKSLNNKHWSACIVCPESDIFEASHRQQSYMTVIILLGIVLIVSFCFCFVSRQLAPLNKLAKSAQRIARGNYSGTIPSTNRTDEIGVLQNSFGTMQTSLYRHIQQMRKLSRNLKEQNETLGAIHEEVKDADNIKMNLIHKIADKMILPIKGIVAIVDDLSARHAELKKDDVVSMSEDVMNHTKTITDLLDQMLDIPKKNKKDGEDKTASSVLDRIAGEESETKNRPNS